MLSKLFNRKKNWFTLIEVLIGSAFAILVSGIIIAINRAYVFMNNTRVRIRSTNFAREWIEMMFNIRDTNWRRHSWERDIYWLDGIYWNGVYGIWEGINANNDRYFYLYPLNVDSSSIEDFYSDDGFWNDAYANQRQNAAIQFYWNYNYMEYSGGVREPRVGTLQSLLWNDISFYRIVRVFGVYKKDVPWSDVLASNEEARGGSPVEMRFCVKVFYQYENAKNSSELCSIMTNFME